MATNPLRLAQREAQRLNQELGLLFARAGTLDHPNGRILVAYRNARRALGAVKTYGEIMEILSGLRLAVQSTAQMLLSEAAQAGNQDAVNQLGFYGETGFYLNNNAAILPALDAVLAGVDRQIKIVQAVTLSGGETTIILGDGERLGVVQPAPIIRDLANWLVTITMDSFFQTVQQARKPFKKQAVAALDGRTTDCCLRVHGQIQPLDQPFELTGTPRFADRLEHSPFHWYCRTSVVLYLSEFDDGLTEEMERSAQQIMKERTEGGGDRHPADAFA